MMDMRQWNIPTTGFYRLLTHEPEFLNGAFVADKIAGKAACYDKPVTGILPVLDKFFRKVNEKETEKI